MKKITKLLGIIISTLVMPLCLMAKTLQDTTTVYYDGNWRPTEKNGIVYESKQWKENGLWYQHDFYYPSLKPQMTGSYADTDRKKRDGIFIWYYPNGTKKDSTIFSNNINNGPSIGWYDNGRIYYNRQYKNGILVDTSTTWYENGKKNQIVICDKNGNGTEQLFFEDGKKMGGGSLNQGKRNGQFKFFDANKIIS